MGRPPRPTSGLAAASQPNPNPEETDGLPGLNPENQSRPEMRPPTPQTAMRPKDREALRADDPIAAAEARAAELMGHLGDLDEGTDEFYINREEIPPGWDYQWKTKTVLGQEDPAYQVAIRRAGWEPVPASRHPAMMPDGGKYPVIERKGMILCERPKIISDRAADIQLKRARAQVRTKEEQLNAAPPGHFERQKPGGEPLAQVSHDYAPIEIPD